MENNGPSPGADKFVEGRSIAAHGGRYVILGMFIELVPRSNLVQIKRWF